MASKRYDNQVERGYGCWTSYSTVSTFPMPPAIYSVEGICVILHPRGRPSVTSMASSMSTGNRYMMMPALKRKLRLFGVDH